MYLKCMFCLCMCVAHAYNAHGGTLGLELQMVGTTMWVLKTKPRSSAKPNVGTAETSLQACEWFFFLPTLVFLNETKNQFMYLLTFFWTVCFFPIESQAPHYVERDDLEPSTSFCRDLVLQACTTIPFHAAGDGTQSSAPVRQTKRTEPHSQPLQTFFFRNIFHRLHTKLMELTWQSGLLIAEMGSGDRVTIYMILGSSKLPPTRRSV